MSTDHTMDSRVADFSMEMEVLDPGELLQELRPSATHPETFAVSWSMLNLLHDPAISLELHFLQRLVELKDQPTLASNCGLTFYSLQNYPSATLLELETRASELYFERGFYPKLYDELIRLWKDEDKTERKKIILSGNAGIGKSWFQVYLLRRLLTSDDRMFRFVLRHVGEDFFFYDLETCAAYEVSGTPLHVKKVISNHGGILYLYEPAQRVDQPPLFVTASSLSTLSHCKNGIKRYYLKTNPHLLYMPAADYNELECIAAEEELDLDVLAKNYEVFGGTTRYALFQTDEERDQKMKEVNARCDTVTMDVLRSIGADIDDDPNERNISDFVVSYTNIPLDGKGPFRSSSLTLTSRYVEQRISERMSLRPYREHLKNLARVIDGRQSDHSGLDLEKSVVFMLSLGPKAVPWQYQGVLGELDTNVMSLTHTKRGINRSEEIDKALVNYPRDKSFPLCDCVVVIKGVHWAFQTTWQQDHALKLRTLRSCRLKLKLADDDVLNIAFVNPAHTIAYANRRRDNYLAKGEDVGNDIKDSKGQVLLCAKDVKTMWENTHVYVAYPKGNDWQTAIAAASSVPKRMKGPFFGLFGSSETSVPKHKRTRFFGLFGSSETSVLKHKRMRFFGLIGSSEASVPKRKRTRFFGLFRSSEEKGLVISTRPERRFVICL